MNKLDLETNIEEWKELIRQGLGSQVRSQISPIDLKDVPRSLKAPLANIARRVGSPNMALKLLFDHVKPDTAENLKATADELAEYAASLTTIGAVPEALKTLAKVDPKQNIDQPLYMAFALFKIWDSEGAAPHLHHYIELQKDEYLKHVGMINLAAVLVDNGHYETARGTIDKLLKYTKDNDHQLLYGNALELKGRMEVLTDQLQLARKTLNESISALEASKSRTIIYSQKWLSVANALDNPGRAYELLGPIKQEARMLRDWETLRDCDRHLANILVDKSLFQRVYYGTPHACYKMKLLESTPIENPLEGDYYISESADGRPSGPVLNLETGQLSDAKKSLKPGQTIHRLFSIFSSDQYKPFSVGETFARLFPEEYFNPHSSPNRIYHCVTKARTWIKENNVPLSLEQTEFGYRFRVRGEVSIKISRARTSDSDDKLATVIALLKKNVGQQEFSARNASSELKMSIRSMNRILKEGIKEGTIVQIGKGPATKYKIAS